MMGKQRLSLAVSAAISLTLMAGCSTTIAVQKTTTDWEDNVQVLHVAHHSRSAQQNQHNPDAARRAERLVRERQIDNEILAAALQLGFGPKPVQKAPAKQPQPRKPQPQRVIPPQNNHTNAPRHRAPPRSIPNKHYVGPKIPPVETVIEQEVNRLYVPHRISIPVNNRNSMWMRIKNGYRLGREMRHPTVRKVLKQYASNPQRLNRIFSRSTKYLHFVLYELNRRGMPTELALLPMVESAYTNRAVSRSGAVGMWQFMPVTGKRFGLQQTRNYDGRMDIFASTRAALDYLQKLNREFRGDWYLTLAAYNAGETKVHRELARNRLSGLPADYWNIRLSKETREYVPRLLAYKEILQRPYAYGVNLPPAPNVSTLIQANINKAVNLRKVARSVGLPASTLVDLNPSFKNGISNPRHSRQILMPRQHANALHHVIQRSPVAHVASYTPRSTKPYKVNQRGNRTVNYRVRSGESLFRIAMRHGTTVEKIMRLNGLRNTDLKAGRHLRIAVNDTGKRYS